MSPLELALRHMKIVFDGLDPRGLDSLLSDDFRFEGPLYVFDNKKDYIRSFLDDPPTGFEYQMISVLENENTVALFYEFKKPGVSVPMAQLFDITNGKINCIRLIFDTGPFRT